MRYKLSKLIPMRFQTECERPPGTPVHITWWQWRGRIMGYRKVAAT